MLNKVIDAIQSRQYLSFTYSGFHRVVQPAAVGTSSKGNNVLRCYQIAGGHVTPGHEWDLCYLSEIVSLAATGDNFIENPPGYKRGDKAMTRIYAQL